MKLNKTTSKNISAHFLHFGQLQIILSTADFALFWLHCNEKPIYVFPEKELRCLSRFHTHVSVSDMNTQDQSTYIHAAE